jgi:hypothetical protein
MGAWHEDRLADWLSVVIWLWLDIYTSMTCMSQFTTSTGTWPARNRQSRARKDLLNITEHITLWAISYKEGHKKTPLPESASKLYRLSGRCLPATLVPTFADRRCHVVSVTDPYGRILGFLDWNKDSMYRKICFWASFYVWSQNVATVPVSLIGKREKK